MGVSRRRPVECWELVPVALGTRRGRYLQRRAVCRDFSDAETGPTISLSRGCQSDASGTHAGLRRSPAGSKGLSRTWRQPPGLIRFWARIGSFVANKVDGSRFHRRVGRPRIDEGTERVVVQMAKESPSRGYDRIVGALANPGNQPSKRRQEGKRERCGVGSDRATC
jgi:hypothetical protein